jgi:hypothetical protein
MYMCWYIPEGKNFCTRNLGEWRARRGEAGCSEERTRNIWRDCNSSLAYLRVRELNLFKISMFFIL